MFAGIKVFIILTLVVLGIKYSQYLNPSFISSFVDKSVLAPLVFIAICTVRPVLFFLPSIGLTIVAGVLFGAIWGTVYVSIGGAFSTIVGFYFARWLGRDEVKRFAGISKSIGKMDEWAKKHGKNAVLSMRLFNLPWDIVSYWAGLSGVKFREFYIASMIPLLPVSFLYTYFGSKVFTPTSAGFIVSLIIMFVIGAVPFIKRRREKNARD